MIWRVKIPVAVIAALLVLPACTVSGAAGSVDQLRVGKGAAACPPAVVPVPLYKEDADGNRQYVSFSKTELRELQMPVSVCLD